MELDLYQVDAFTDKVFGGNPAAVCPLDAWLPDEVLQNIALENNLSETAFFVKTDAGYHLRWFTPAAEVELCGHATMAAAFVIFNFIDTKATTLTFDSQSGPLIVHKNNDGLRMDFPAWPREETSVPPELTEVFGMTPVAYFKGHDNMAIFETQKELSEITPNFQKMMAYVDTPRGVIATAPADKGTGLNFVSRAFYPDIDVPEDPVTGSAHCMLTPYWADRLGKTKLNARQISARGGNLLCELKGERVELTGQAVLYMKGTIFI